jgi:DNA polymerase III subunit gamma/tau
MADTSSHLVLARKWRPERFSDLVGQEYVTRTLAQAIASGRIAHAFLFTGIRGVGKTTAARILARCLNCERGPTAEPCGECAACIEIRQGRALDVVEIDGATYRKIDDARTIIENLSYRPARDRFKIYIIDEAHQLTDQAFNALLKTLEEPPAHVKFILATTEPQKVPETILSRLQRYDFRRIPFAIILERLRDLARREGIEAEDGALAMLARESEGSMRDAERMLETAFALSPGGGLTESLVADSLGVASRSRVYALAEAIINKDPAAALTTVRELHSRGANLQGLGRDLLEVLRNLTVAKLPQLGAITPLSDLPDHEAAALRKLAQGPSMRDLLRLFRLMAQAQEEILRSPYADLMLEMTVVRMATLAPVMDADDLARAVKALGGNTPAVSGGGPSGARATTPAAPEPANAPARRLKVEGEVKADAPRRKAAATEAPARPAAAQAQPASSNASSPDSSQTAPDLPELREYIRQKKAALAGFMEMGATLALSGDNLRVVPRSDIYIRYLNDNKSTIAVLASEHYGRPIKVELAQPAAEESPAPPPVAPQPAQKAAPENPQPAAPKSVDFQSSMDAAMQSAPAETNGEPIDREATRKELFSDPMVRKILDELEGRLVDVRRPAVKRNEGSRE